MHKTDSSALVADDEWVEGGWEEWNVSYPVLQSNGCRLFSHTFIYCLEGKRMRRRVYGRANQSMMDDDKVRVAEWPFGIHDTEIEERTRNIC